MDLKKIALATATGAALFAAVPAFAHGWDHRHHARYYRAPVYVYASPAYYVRPAPVYYAPPPVYYAPRPAIYGRIPLGHHSSFGFSLPLY
jgi:hypothetical protein